MVQNLFSRRLQQAGSLILLSLILAACAPSNGGKTLSRTAVRDQPRNASYNCGDAGRLQVESLGASIRVTDTSGNVTELPAAPPAQRARFGITNQAIVIEDGEALYMVSGKPTLTCRRG